MQNCKLQHDETRISAWRRTILSWIHGISCGPVASVQYGKQVRFGHNRHILSLPRQILHEPLDALHRKVDRLLFFIPRGYITVYDSKNGLSQCVRIQEIGVRDVRQVGSTNTDCDIVTVRGGYIVYNS